MLRHRERLAAAGAEAVCDLVAGIADHTAVEGLTTSRAEALLWPVEVLTVGAVVHGNWHRSRGWLWMLPIAIARC
jgi:hypothetical protein